MKITKDNYKEYVGKIVGQLDKEGRWEGGGELVGRCTNSGLYILKAFDQLWSCDSIGPE